MQITSHGQAGQARQARQARQEREWVVTYKPTEYLGYLSCVFHELSLKVSRDTRFGEGSTPAGTCN